ncbi:MAG: hypothetical protein BWY53_00663 [Parcubacteria group bacterium ADurb.Bin326]|nr:MAG: hypothetical protein BWY53_00663 [Parcubacteria group bacterium ADurb.Bin326]
MKHHTVNINTGEAPAMIASVATTCLFLLIEKLDELIGKLPDGYAIDFGFLFKETKNSRTGEGFWIGGVSIEMTFRALQSESREAARLTLTRVSGVEISERGKYRWLPYQPSFVQGRDLEVEALAIAIETGIGRSDEDRVYRENLAIRLPNELPMFVDMETPGIETQTQPEGETE